MSTFGIAFVLGEVDVDAAWKSDRVIAARNFSLHWYLALDCAGILGLPALCRLHNVSTRKLQVDVSQLNVAPFFARDATLQGTRMVTAFLGSWTVLSALSAVVDKVRVTATMASMTTIQSTIAGQSAASIRCKLHEMVWL